MGCRDTGACVHRRECGGFYLPGYNKKTIEIMSRKKAGTSQTPFQKRQAVLNTVLSVLLVFSIGLLLNSNQKLKASIQEERVASVRQIGNQITEKITILKDSYVKKTIQDAYAVEYVHVATLSHLRDLLGGDEEIILICKDGSYLTLDGTHLIVNDADLIQGILSGSEVNSSFATIATKGDYWLFSQSIADKQIDDNTVIGVACAVDAQEYADVATISLYDHSGSSYVVSSNGAILMKPKDTTGNPLFGGYSILSMLQEYHVSETDRAKLADALLNGTEYSFTATISGVTWLIQSQPSESDRSIVVAVPISKTAQSTYSGLRDEMISIATVIALLAAILFVNTYFGQKRTQELSIEQTKAKTKSDFMDKMSHDIRTPLNSIVGMNELALRSLDDRGVVENCLKNSRASSQYLVSVINDVLDMSKIESGKMTVARREFSMNELLDYVMQMEQIPAEQKHIQLLLEKNSPVQTDFIGDATRLEQCLTNLISNAVKFTPENGTIRIGYESVAAENGLLLVRLSVADNGIGMSPEFMKRIFKPFEQETNSMTSGNAGSGLGLSIVYNLVSLMGGSVTAESKLNAGSRFTIEVPLETTKASAGGSVDEEALKKQWTGRKILVAEDNEMNMKIISMLLEKMGLTTVKAENGEAAVEEFSRSHPGELSMMLMDINMPVMGGLEAARRIRALDRPDAKSIPIVALSANAYSDDVQRSINAGMQDHLAKPINVDELIRTLSRYIQ